MEHESNRGMRVLHGCRERFKSPSSRRATHFLKGTFVEDNKLMMGVGVDKESSLQLITGQQQRAPRGTRGHALYARACAEEEEEEEEKEAA